MFANHIDILMKDVLNVMIIAGKEVQEKEGAQEKEEVQEKEEAQEKEVQEKEEVLPIKSDPEIVIVKGIAIGNTEEERRRKTAIVMRGKVLNMLKERESGRRKRHPMVINSLFSSFNVASNSNRYNLITDQSRRSIDSGTNHEKSFELSNNPVAPEVNEESTRSTNRNPQLNARSHSRLNGISPKVEVVTISSEDDGDDSQVISSLLGI